MPGNAPRVFVHPGGLHTKDDIERMRSKVAQHATPWIECWNLLIQDRKASSTYRAAPNPAMPSRQRAQDDACAAYLNALRWCISGDTANADCAVRILNSWSMAIVDSSPGPAERGLSGIPIGSFALAAEVLRGYPGWPEADQLRFKRMLRERLYPLAHDFLTNHSGRHNDSFWANWDFCNMLALVAIGVYCDDSRIFDEGIAYYRHGQGMGGIMNAVPFLYPGGLGQWQESGRDHAHALGGMGLAAEMCQVAWNQGIDLFAESDNRLLAGAEYEAQFNQWIGVPYTFYTNGDNANQFYISQNYHGRLGNCQFYELLYNHYVIRRKISAPQTKAFAELLRPEGGNVDIMGYGTLTYTLDAAASPYPPSPIPPAPRDLVATPGLGRVMLHWSPSGAYSTHGYEISRSPTRGGPYASIFTTNWNTTPSYTDSQVEAGRTYYYVVTATNQAGASPPSAEVAATPARGGALPEDWKTVQLGNPNEGGSCLYADAVGRTLRITAGAGDIGGKADTPFAAYQVATGDTTLTVRLSEISGSLAKIGLIMREHATADAAAVAITLGEAGGRQTRFRVRPAAGADSAVQAGHDYVWPIAWFRLQRIGDSFTAWQSSDGIVWFKFGSADVPMKDGCLVGIAACSRQAGEKVTAVFDHVRIETAPPPPPSAPADLVAAPGSDSIRLSWQLAAGQVDGWKIECSRDGLNFYEITDLSGAAREFVNTGLAERSYRYRVRAYNSGGYSDYSPIVTARPLPGSVTSDGGNLPASGPPR